MLTKVKENLLWRMIQMRTQSLGMLKQCKECGKLIKTGV